MQNKCGNSCNRRREILPVNRCFCNGMEQHDEILSCTLQNTHIRLLKLETGISLQKKNLQEEEEEEEFYWKLEFMK